MHSEVSDDYQSCVTEEVNPKHGSAILSSSNGVYSLKCDGSIWASYVYILQCLLHGVPNLCSALLNLQLWLPFLLSSLQTARNDIIELPHKIGQSR